MKRQVTPQELESELKRFLEAKQKLNPRYSVRAMAMHLGVLDSTLQKVLRGESRLGLRVAKDIALHLDIEIVKEKKPRTPKWRLKTLDVPVGAEPQWWVSFAILEMIKLKEFQPQTDWVAQRLGLEPQQVELVLEKMIANKMIECTSTGWTDLMSDATNAARGLITSQVVRGIQKDLLHLSHAKIDAVPYQNREHAFTVFPVARRDLAKLKKRIVEFSWEIASLAQKSSLAKDDVYSLQLGFFPLTETGSVEGQR